MDEQYRQKLLQILAASGLSQDTLAGRLEVSFATLNAWVNGRTAPRPSAQQKIDLLAAEILGSDSVDRDRLVKRKKIATTRRMTAFKISENRDLLEKMTVNLTYHSNGTEGSTMTERDVAAVILSNRVLANRTAREQREAINHQTALHFLLDELLAAGKSFAFTPELIRAVHLRLMNGLISDAGQLRRAGARIRGAHVPLANFIKIDGLLTEWCNRQNEETADPIGLLARSHAEFEQIHPFSDGNGRTGRLLLFIKALHLGMAPPIIKKERRSAYYKYLELCQLRELSDPLEQFLADTIIETADEFDLETL